ncbi:MAG TPA: MFS transporter [Candidatus Binatia bacterium]|jgi:sugar phosphate permease|nr:MFS transporter [Candidatus Binatia bacterium]
MDPIDAGIGRPARNQRFFYGWFIVGIVFFISIIDGGFTYIFSAFLKPLSQEFGWTRAETAGAFSLYLLATGLVLPLWGWLADRTGVRRVFLFSALIDGVALFLLSYVRSLSAFYLLYLFLGVGLAGIGPMSVGKIISQWFVAKRGRAVGVALIGAGAGGLVLVPLTGFLIETFNWRVAYQGLAALALGAMLPLVWFFLSDKPEERGLVPLGQDSPADGSADVQGERGSELDGWTLKEALYTPTFWLLGVAFCLGLMAALAVTAHQVAFLQDAGLTLEAASTIAGISLGMSMGGRFMIGWASEHTRHLHPVLALCLVVQAVGLGLLLCLDFLGFWAVTLFVLLFGLGYGGLVVLWPLTISHNFGLRAFGAIAGALGTVAASLGGAVGPVAVGAIYDQTGNYFWAFLACTVILLLGAGAALITPEPSMTYSALTPGRVTGHEGENRSL